MTNQQKPEALRLADSIERMDTLTWYQRDELFKAATELRRLHALTENQQQELIKESHRTAEQKLRADQMTRQHADQAAMNREARAQLAALVEAQQPAPSAVVASKAVLAAIRAANMQLVRTGDDEFMLVTLKKATPQADSVLEDAARYRWLRERSSTMFVSISINGEGAEIAETLDSAVDAARNQGENK